MTLTETIEVPAQRQPPDRRGRTEVTDRAAKKIACQVAGEHDDVHEINDRDGLPWTHSSAARVDRDGIGIRLFVTVVYPVPLRAAASRIREHVSREVTRMTGLPVPSVDVMITSVKGPDS
ncbi:Asp23/Gls24 family envelope stress response protein [Nonomuraea sp. NBC_01738]|uniref:Asp23/Gls24 family envelope stress response protein n=1 Tax=Nonomuraea sp. NBC_01738 TaxID=2976003 RepID=UPI002E155048|nr:Asp23/Gls24 family envelope stress response protein [Nonomuraea sp. NBC_01738]